MSGVLVAETRLHPSSLSTVRGSLFLSEIGGVGRGATTNAHCFACIPFEHYGNATFGPPTTFSDHTHQLINFKQLGSYIALLTRSFLLLRNTLQTSRIQLAPSSWSASSISMESAVDLAMLPSLDMIAGPRLSICSRACVLITDPFP